jgi:TolB-like protein
MPFKNLNVDPSIDWLRLGISETLVTDLRKSGRVTVVERAQVDHALAEIALQSAQTTEASTAARVGKLVGAKTVVLGGFQQAGHQLRITARFVAVESGVVVDTAKVTGKIENVFTLQDEIAARLMGEKGATHGEAKRRRSGPQVLKAYRLYSMSLGASSDADKVSYLRQSLQVDPSFVYAEEDLAALEEKLKRYKQRSEEEKAKKTVALNQAVTDASLSAEERSQKAMGLMSGLASDRRYHQLRAEATRIYSLKLEPIGAADPTEMASYWLFLSDQQLKKEDEALQVGEQHLKQFPGGMHYQSIENQMKALIDARRTRDSNREQIAPTLAGIEKERAERRKEARDPNVLENAQRSLDFERCSKIFGLKQHQRALEECEGFRKKWCAARDPSAQEQCFFASFLRAMAHADLGQYEQAKAIAKQLASDEPQRSKNSGLLTVMDQVWPAD